MPDMIDARDAALDRLLDDAATLPPMQLGPVEALRAHLRLAAGESAWLQGRLLVPLADVGEVEPHLAGTGHPQLVVVLPRVGGAMDSTAGDLGNLVLAMTEGQVGVSALQVGVVGTHPGRTIAETCEALGRAGVDPTLPLCVEVAFADRPAGEVLDTLDALVAGADRPLVATTPGGVATAGDVEMAGLLVACAEARLPLTIGPGLVAPLPSPDGSRHGFLNVLAAAVRAHRGERLGAVAAALSVPASRVRLGSGALILDEDVIETDWIATCRSDLLVSVSATDVPAAVDGLITMGILSATGALA